MIYLHFKPVKLQHWVQATWFFPKSMYFKSQNPLLLWYILDRNNFFWSPLGVKIHIMLKYFANWIDILWFNKCMGLKFHYNSWTIFIALRDALPSQIVCFFLTLFKPGGGQTHVQKFCCKFGIVLEAFWQYKITLKKVFWG